MTSWRMSRRSASAGAGSTWKRQAALPPSSASCAQGRDSGTHLDLSVHEMTSRACRLVPKMQACVRPCPLKVGTHSGTPSRRSY